MSVEVDLDLDALRSARAEARGRPKTMRLAGEVFNLPPEFRCSWMPLIADDDAESGNVLLQEVLGDQTGRFLELATTEDLRELGNHLLVVYGLGSGESPASNGSSSNTGGRSRPTSAASTASTSRKRSGSTKNRSASGG